MAPDSDMLLPAHLPPEIFTAAPTDSGPADVSLPLEEVEKRHIMRVLAHHNDNRSRAAKTLGISRATLYEKLHKYGLA
jgi:two-component system NtrC family response regulator